MIQEISIITTVGAKTYRIGDFIYGQMVAEIVQTDLLFQGDPFDHYVGRSEDGATLFTVNCLTPCVVEYKH